MTQPAPAARRRLARRGATARTRILGWYVLLLAVSLIAALFIQRAFLLDRAETAADEALDQEIAELEALVPGNDPETGEPFGGDLAAIFEVFLSRNVGVSGEGIVTFIGGEPYLADIPGSRWRDAGLFEPWATITDPIRHEVASDDGPVRFVAMPIRAGAETAGVFVAGVAMNERLASVNDAIRLAALVYGSIFVVASLMAWWAAGQVLGPLQDLRRATETISESDLGTRIDVPGDDEISQLATNFNHMLDRLEEAFASQRRFIDDAGHELRTPITIIRGQIDVLDDDPDDRAEAMALVDGELDRMSRIVEDLLVLAREQQPDFVQPRPLDLDALVEDLGARATALADRPVTVEVPDAVVVDADEQRLAQAMMNLVRNSLEHAPPEATITIGARHDADVVVLWVHDDGPGIPAEEQDRVFERFTRGGGHRPSTTGAGLGLAIVAAIARGHGGWAEIDSEPGSTTVSLVIPRVGPDLAGFDATHGTEHAAGAAEPGHASADRSHPPPVAAADDVDHAEPHR